MTGGPRPAKALSKFSRWAGIGLFYVLATGVMTWPLVNYSAFSTASYPGDARLIIWTLAWDNHATINGLPLFESNIYHPARDSLAHNDHLFGISLFTLPIYAVSGNPVLAYNAIWVLSFLLNAIAMHLLLRRYVRDDLAACAGSLVFAFSFYKMLHGHGHLQQVWTWLLPVSVMSLYGWARRPMLTRAFIWAAAVVLQALSSWYLAVIAGLLQVAIVADVALSRSDDGKTRPLWHLAIAGIAGAAAVWPFARHYGAFAVPAVSEAALYSADLGAFLIPPENTWLGQLMLTRGWSGPRWIWGEQTLYLGWIVLLLSAAGILEVIRRRHWRLLAVYGGLVTIGFALSLGPSEQSWTPFEALSLLPGIGSFRAPARFTVLLLLGLAVFVSLGAQWILAVGRRGRVLLLVLVPLMLSEYWVVKFPNGKPQRFDVPPIYRAEALGNAKAIVSLPDYYGKPQWFFEPDYLYYSTGHWRPIVNGYGRSSPPEYPALISAMGTFPAPEAAAAMRGAGVDRVVLHTMRYQTDTTELVRNAKASPDFQLIGRVGADYLFKVVPLP
jgi:hypothetical protein